MRLSEKKSIQCSYDWNQDVLMGYVVNTNDFFLFNDIVDFNMEIFLITILIF